MSRWSNFFFLLLLLLLLAATIPLKPSIQSSSLLSMLLVRTVLCRLYEPFGSCRSFALEALPSVEIYDRMSSTINMTAQNPLTLRE
ncbi:hypothetical protein BC939DRAFT_440914 [Gamsiella multidivaricata]|uniref:uncharacterized protein n=1 Tax=Gamsiella multidivaricata TaxID=101098 RepID=UPI0022201B6D|nr:uncharacterized protein BC939DRAFT_440914 [Gamsiella multidivaricata]KAI7829878.1 hypothetical protein BC939DRAFT_440914 [Gamsiella multidivaricata]